MTLETYTIGQFLQIFGGVAVGALITSVSSRKKMKAEARLADAEAKLKDIESYSTMLADTRKQIESLQSQVNAFQEREKGYLKIIHAQQGTERELRKRITELETKLKTLEKKQNESIK
jgi:septal ring factor EnvC (AmiA/AmiB activator)